MAICAYAIGHTYTDTMPIISVLQPKGGTGKTTLSVHIARGLQLRDYPVVLIDADRQGSSTRWAASGDDTPPCASVSTVKEVEALLRKAPSSHYCVIDGAAHLQRMDAAIIRHSDTILIPILPSPVDVWATTPIARLVKEASATAAFVLSRKKTGTRLSAAIGDVLQRHGLPILSGTHDRVAYATVMGQGRSVEEGADPKAAEEVAAILSFILKHTPHR